MRYRKKIRNQIRGTGQARRRGRVELEGGGEGRRGLRERRVRTNRASDLRRECLRTYPACINKKAAERTEI